MGDNEDLLKEWSMDEAFPKLDRLPSAYNPMHSFVLPKGEHKRYMQQFSDIYFLRLAKLKPSVEAAANDAWQDFEIAGEHAQRVERVLDVRQGQLCWVAGTIYMDLPLKPNILDELSKEHWVAGPPPRQSYYSTAEDVQVMLEDESGRLRLTGVMLRTNLLVTGAIVAVLGTEKMQMVSLRFWTSMLPIFPVSHNDGSVMKPSLPYKVKLTLTTTATRRKSFLSAAWAYLEQKQIH